MTSRSISHRNDIGDLFGPHNSSNPTRSANGKENCHSAK